MTKKIFSILALLCMAISGAWAADTYTITATYGEQSADVSTDATLPYETTLAACYKAAIGTEPGSGVSVTGANITSGTNVTIGTINNWDTPITITAEGVAHIELVATFMGMPMSGAAFSFTVTKNAPTPEYYLVGDMNGWTVSSEYQLQPNTENEGEYYIHNVTLTKGKGIKVVSSTDGSTAGTWYPSGDNYSVAEDGIYSVYFRPEGGVSGWYEGVFYVEKTAEAPVSYYLVGDINEWKIDATYLLQPNTETEGEYYIHRVAMTNGQKFKVASSIDGTDIKDWYPNGSDNDYVVNADANYDIYFRPDGQGGDGWHHGVIFAQEAAIYVIPTENKNEWTFLMPAYDVEVNVEYETALALNEVEDNTAKLDEWNGYEADITLTRTLQTGGWNTLAVPFSIDAANFAALQTLLTAQGGSIALKQLGSTEFNAGTLTLNFEDATSIEAGKPYLVKVSNSLNLATLPATIDAYAALSGLNIANPFKGVEVSKTAVLTETTYADFIPTLGKTLVTGPAGDESNTEAVLFIGANNKLYNPTVVNNQEQEASYMKGFRAYFQLKGEATAARSFELDFGNGETTGIITLNVERGTMNGETFDLQGRRVNSAAQKGVYIVNGKKTVIK